MGICPCPKTTPKAHIPIIGNLFPYVYIKIVMKQRFRKIWSALIVLIMSSPLAFASTPPVVTLSEAIESAEENSISLESARVTLSQAMRNADAVMTTFMPEISATASATTGAAFPGTNPQSLGFTELGSDITEPAFLGLSVSASLNAQFSFTGNMITDGETRRLQRESASLAYENSWSSLEEAITAAYWNIAAQDAAIESAKLALEDYQAQYDNAREMYDNGLTDELSVLQLQLSLRNAELQVKTLEDSRAIMAAAFSDMTGIEGDFTVSEFPGLTVLSLPSAEDLFSQYSENTLDVKIARSNLKISENSVDTAKLSTYVPVLTASLGYSYSGSGFQKYQDYPYVPYSNSGHQLTGTVSMTIPISSMLPGSSSSMAIKDAEDNAKLMALNLQNTKNTLLEDIREDVISINQYQSNIGMLQETLDTANMSYDLAKQSYDAGLMTADDLSSARNDVLTAEINLLNTELSHLQSCYSLSFTLGIDINELFTNYASSEENS